MKTLRLEYGSFRVGVSCADPAVLDWLAEFLTPAFAVGNHDGDPVDRAVGFVVDPARCAEIERERDAAATVVRDGFTFDGSFSRHRFWAEGETTWIDDADDGSGAFLRVLADGRRFEIVAPDFVGRSPRFLMRTIRELATVAMYRVPCLPVHGASFATDDGAVLVCGLRRSGKTSTLVHALRCGARFVSNDRVFVDTRDAPSARAMPTIVMLRDGMFEYFPEFRAAFKTARYEYRRRLTDCAPGIERPDPVAPPGRAYQGISPRQLCALLGADAVAGGRLRAVLLPRIDPEVRGLELERIAPDAAFAALRENLLTPSAPTRFSEVFAPDDPGGEVAPESEDVPCRRLADRVAAFRCRLGPQAYEGDLLAALAEAERVS